MKNDAQSCVLDIILKSNSTFIKIITKYTTKWYGFHESKSNEKSIDIPGFFCMQSICGPQITKNMEPLEMKIVSLIYRRKSFYDWNSKKEVKVSWNYFIQWYRTPKSPNSG